VGDVDSLHVEIDNLNDPLVGFCFIRSIDWPKFKRLDSKNISPAKKKHISVEVITLGCKNIWRERNGKIFKNERPSLRSWKRKVKKKIWAKQKKTPMHKI
jgi:hypothetical protein